MSGGKLPEGWVVTSISSAISNQGLISDGDWVESKDQDPNGSVRLVQLADIGDGYFKDKSNRYMTSEKAQMLSCTYLSPGDVLVARMPDPLGRACIFPGVNQKAVTVVDVCLLRTSSVSAISNTILKYWINSPELRTAIAENASGSTRKRITRKKLEQLEIPVASLAEQKTITEKLDTLLTQVDSTRARLEQIPQILKRFRQAVLAAAVSGKFTADTGSIQSPLTIGNETSISPKGWQWYKLTDLAQLESGHTPRKTISEYWDNGDIPWISLQDIRAAHGKVIYKTKFMPTQKGIDNSSARLLPEGTVCFSRDISVGYSTIMGISMATTQHFANWICGEKINNKYLMFSFMAAKQNLTKSGQGTTVKTIYMPALKELHILTPPLPEQHEIVHRVEQLFAYADTIEKQVSNALTRVNNLTQSILAKAFRGELTAQWRAENPDLISGENSAAMLLEKIKAERAASSGKKNARKKA